MEIVDTWLKEPFEGGRHQRRVELIDTLTGGSQNEKIRAEESR